MQTLENCSGQSKPVLSEVFPESEDEVIAYVRHAQREKFKIHPVSTGYNWGYGSRLPYDESACILNLSKMNQILDFNPELGTVRIQPGVTQQQLSDYLKKNNYDFLVPTTGAGGNVSLLGNTLERGYGLTPWVDHFLSLTSLRAVLPDASVYESFYQEIGCDEIGSIYKWGLGPYLDGLFSQSSLGVVTEATLCLQKRSEKISIVLGGARSQEEFLSVIPVIRQLINDSGQMIAGINFINSLRTVSMLQSCPEEALKNKRPLNLNEIRNLEKDLGLFPWNLVLTLYGSKDLVQTLEKRIKRKLSFLGRAPMVFNESKFSKLDRLFSLLPFLKSTQQYNQVQRLKKVSKIFYGMPDSSAHQLTNWRTGLTSPAETKLDQSQVGLMWYAPLIPFTERNISEAIAMISRVVRQFGFDPLITLTATSDRYVVATLALCFSRATKEEIERAQKCYEKLVAEGLSQGIYPYRTGTLPLGNALPPHQGIAKKIKDLLDPQGMLDPGRPL